MMGYAHAAGYPKCCSRAGSESFAERFSVPWDRLERALVLLEAGHRPEILLLQHPKTEVKVAVTFFSSVWSKAYEKVGTPYGKVHRDFHYQCLFAAMSALVEIGCTKIRVENPMSGHYWRKDAYVCLAEAVRNIQRLMNPSVFVHLEPGSYNEQMVKDVDDSQSAYNMQEHRPIGISMHLFEGLNMRTIFVERAEIALRHA